MSRYGGRDDRGGGGVSNDRYGGRGVFIGNLPLDVRERELEDLFYKVGAVCLQRGANGAHGSLQCLTIMSFLPRMQFGRIRMVDIKRPARPPAFAFVEFDDPRCVAP